MKKVKNIIIFVSGNGSNMSNLIAHFETDAEINVEAIFSNKKECLGVKNAQEAGVNTVVFSKKELERIYSANCINGQSISEFSKSDVFSIAKRENVEKSSSNDKRQRDNIKDLVKELKKTTKCKTPKIIKVPVLYRDGFSYTPELVNGAVQTPPSGASKIILPRTYLRVFDDYVKRELGKVGVKATLVNDLNYHLNSGEIHCGTNSARLCK